jgi:hypothetical protein
MPFLSDRLLFLLGLLECTLLLKEIGRVLAFFFSLKDVMLCLVDSTGRLRYSILS